MMRLRNREYPISLRAASAKNSPEELEALEGNQRSVNTGPKETLRFSVRLQNRKRSSRPENSLILLSLPDEPLSLILCHLGADNTGGTFQAPRHAFALAQTNSRLLRLFASCLKHITPDLSNLMPRTLSFNHILSVARLAGLYLRELHLPSGLVEIIPDLSRICPRLESLSFKDHWLRKCCGLADVLYLPLHSLAIDKPSRNSLRLFIPPPRQLTLTNVHIGAVNELSPIFLNPPKKLILSFMKPTQWYFIDDLESNALPCFSEAILKIESVSIKAGIDPMNAHMHEEWHVGKDFTEEAALLISEARCNHRESSCMSIKLEGDQLFELLKYVHPKAEIEISNGRQAFVDFGEGTYARKLNLEDNYLPEAELTHLQEISIGEKVHQCWREILPRINLKRALVTFPWTAAELGITAKTVEIPFVNFHGGNWKWLNNVLEVRVVGPTADLSRVEQETFFRTVTNLLHHYHGQVFWIATLTLYPFTRFGVDSGLRCLLRASCEAVKKFEERGGDAGTVKELIYRLLSC